jgi:hypothetical protein
LIASYRKLKRGAWAKCKLVLQILFAAFRALFIPVWLLLLLVEYTCLTVYFSLRRKSTSGSNKNPLAGFAIAPQRSVKPGWKQAYGILGLDSIYPLDKKKPSHLDHNEMKAASRAATFLVPTSRRTARSETFDSSSASKSGGIENPHSKKTLSYGVPAIGAQASDEVSLDQSSEADEVYRYC